MKILAGFCPSSSRFGTSVSKTPLFEVHSSPFGVDSPEPQTSNLEQPPRQALDLIEMSRFQFAGRLLRHLLLCLITGGLLSVVFAPAQEEYAPVPVAPPSGEALYSQAEQEKGAAIMAETRKAYGGLEKLKSIRHVKLEGTQQRLYRRRGIRNIEIYYATKAPKILMVDKYASGRMISQCLVGDFFWEVGVGERGGWKPPDRAPFWRRIWRWQLPVLLTLEGPFHFMKELCWEGRDILVVRVMDPDDHTPLADLWIDAETHLIAKVGKWDVVSPEGEQEYFEFIWEEHKPVGGVPFPHVIREESTKWPFIIKIEKVTFNPPLDERIFEPQ